MKIKLTQDYFVEGQILKSGTEVEVIEEESQVTKQEEMAVDPLVASIRAELKNRFGYNARQISVSRPRYSAVNLTIRDPRVKLEDIKDFAHEFESIDYDQATGEILAGGNTFVFVDYSDDVRDALSAKYRPLVLDTVADLDPNEPRYSQTVPGIKQDISIGYSEYGTPSRPLYTVFIDGMLSKGGNQLSLDSAAFVVGKEIESNS